MYSFVNKQFEMAFFAAINMMQEIEGLEPTSAFKQAARDHDIEDGAELEAFVALAHKKLFGGK